MFYLASFIAALVFGIALGGFASFVAATEGGGDTNSVNACSYVLQQGIYNTYTSTGTSSTYAAFQQTMCNVGEGFTYAAYLAAKSAPNNALWFAVNTAAAFLHIGNGAGDLVQAEFEQFLSLALSYQSAYCGALGNNDGTPETFNNFMSTVNPEVYAAYQSCIALYATGIRFSAKHGYASASTFINVQFISSTFGAKALLTGVSIFPENGATCTLYGDTGATDKFYINLVPDETYSIACKVNGEYPLNDVVTIGISTTHGTYLTYVYNREPGTLLETLQTQVNQLSSQVHDLLEQYGVTRRL